MCNLKSDIGAKAAWKGFSSQTTYIAHRLMNLGDDYDFYPEKVEDLMIKKDNSIIELVQIKNLSRELALSSLSPKDSDSFFKRALKSRKGNDSIILKVISFGKIGQELQGLINKNEVQIKNIKNKLLGYKYSVDEIEWILSNLSIIQVDEENLKKDILKKLEKRIETMAAPQIAFDTLICYVSDLSRYASHTSREKWNNRIDDFVKDIASINGVCVQYGKTIIKLADYKTLKTNDELTKEYRIGVNAHPQHIRNDLDIEREEWLQRIQDCFENNNIVIVKGASGQGKSSLAYRYLINNYLENYVFVVEKIINAEQAIDIVAALNGLSISKSGDIAVYLDVVPYDNEWIWVAEEINKRGMNLKLLITIREEDFNRSHIDLNIFKSNVIEILFTESEAKIVFNKYHSPNFLDFKQAWEKFGENGPFMEFMYLITQADTLKNKLESQINRIIDKEVNSDNWLDILKVICYAGQNSLKINLNRLIDNLPCNQSMKMLKQFEKEYLVKVSSDNQYVECLHAVRAEILYNIISENSMMSEEKTLLYSVSAIDEFFQALLVKYLYNNTNVDSLIEKLSKNEFSSWTAYASVLSALLWLDTYRFYMKNKEVYDKGNKLFSNNFIMFNGDTTGYIELDSKKFTNSFKTINQGLAQKYDDLISSLPEKRIDYKYTDMFISKVKDKLNGLEIVPNSNLSEVGFVLFWLAQRNIFLNRIFCENVIRNINNYSFNNILDFIVGIQMQNKSVIYNKITKYLIPKIIDKYNIIRLIIEENYIEAEFIQNLFEHNIEENHEGNNGRVMLVVYALRRLFLHKERYHVKLLGNNIVSGIQMPDIEKNINSKNLPLTWIVQMNGWLMKIDKYEKRTENWNEFRELIDNDRKSIINFSKLVCDGIEHFYKNGGNIEKFTSKEYKKSKQEISEIAARTYRTPKCSKDKYGLNVDKNKVKLIDSTNNKGKEESNKSLTSCMSNYKNSFSSFAWQKDELIISIYKREAISEDARLSLINIVSAVSELVIMQNKYSEIFPKNCNYINFTDEYEQVLLLAVMWKYLYKNKIKKDKSIVYSCKEMIKQNRIKIKNFFGKIFKNYNVQQIEKISGKIIHFSLEPTLIDDFCVNLFSKFKLEFLNATPYSVDSIFLNEYAQKIVISIQVYENKIIGGIIIDIKNLIYCNELEKFMDYRQTLDKNEIDEVNNQYLNESDKLYNKYKIIGNLNILLLFYNHTISIMEYTNLHNEDISIQEKVFMKWRDNAAKFYCSIIEDIISSFEKLHDGMPMELYGDYENIVTLLNKYKDKSLDIVIIDDTDIINEIIVKINEPIESFFDNYNFV